MIEKQMIEKQFYLKIKILLLNQIKLKKGVTNYDRFLDDHQSM